MALTQREHYLAETVDWAFPQAPPHPSPGQQAQSVEALRTRTLPQAITAASPASTKRKRQPRPKLDNEKCARCRKDKVKCSPQPRSWPDKCERCSTKGFDCSPGEVKRRAKRKSSPTSLNSPVSKPSRRDHQVSEIRHQIGHESAKPQVDDIQESWDFADMTNLITIVQLLNHERSLLAEANSYIQKLDLKVDLAAFSNNFRACGLDAFVPKLIGDFRRILRDRQHSESLTVTNQLLYENSHQAIGEDFVVPRNDPISEASLAELPSGVQVRHLVRKLRLKIQHRGSCNFKPLDWLLFQLENEWSGWKARLGFLAPHGRLSSSPHFRAAYSLVVSQEFPTEPLIRIWVRDYILRAGDEISPFFIARFAELWNADSDSINLFTLVGGDTEARGELPLLYVAVLCNKPQIVRVLLKYSLDTRSQLTFAHFTAFYFAASVGSVDCYRSLLRCEGAKSVEEKAVGNGDLPLHIAARNGHKHLVDYILGLRSDNSTYINERNWSGETPLMQAAESGQYDVVQFLLDYPGVDIAAADGDGKIALGYADQNEDTFRLILSKLPDQYFNTLDEFGVTPFHSLANSSGQKAIHSVLSLSLAIPDKEDKYGETPLCHAVRGGNLGAVKALGVRRDVDVTKLSTCKPGYYDTESYIDLAKLRAQNDNKYSQILDWLKIHCKELEADLADWEISNEDTDEEA